MLVLLVWIRDLRPPTWHGPLDIPLKKLSDRTSFVIADIGEALDGSSVIVSDVLENLQEPRDVVVRGDVGEHSAQGRPVLDPLRATLTLVLTSVAISWQSLGRRLGVLDVRGSIGCAASPINTALPRIHVSSGDRNMSVQSFKSSACLCRFVRQKRTRHFLHRRLRPTCTLPISAAQNLGTYQQDLPLTLSQSSLYLDQRATQV